MKRSFGLCSVVFVALGFLIATGCGSGSSSGISPTPVPTPVPTAQISLPTSSITVGSLAGTTATALLTITTGTQAQWTANSSTSWIHLTDTSGTTAALGSVVRFTYDANTGATRTGTINFQSTAFNATLTVAQAGVGYVAAVPPLTMQNIFPAIPVGTPLPASINFAVDIAGNIYYASPGAALAEWAAATGSTSSFQFPGGVVLGAGAPSFVDQNRNGFFYSSVSGQFYEWALSTAQATSLPNLPQALVANGLGVAAQLAADFQGNIYASGNITDQNTFGASEPISVAVYSLTNGSAGWAPLLNIPSSYYSYGFATDASGTLYDLGETNAGGGLPTTGDTWSIIKADPQSAQASTLATGAVDQLPGFDFQNRYPGMYALALDGSGNLYFAIEIYELGNTLSWESYLAQWSPATGQITADNQTNAWNVIGDGLGNIYVETLEGTIEKFSPVFIDTTNVSEPATAGSDQLPPVLPATTALNAVSDSDWLAITSQTNGVVSFSFTAATAARTAHITLLSQTITISQDSPAPAVAPHTFVPITPCRVADTEMSTGTASDFSIAGSSCGIPSNAQAFALNVTVVPNASLRFLTAWPAGAERPIVSTLNSDGRKKSVAAIVAAGTNGGVSVYASDATQVTLDVTGYFAPAGSTPAGLAYYPLTSCRVADTRGNSGPYLKAGQSRSIAVRSSACQVPATAQAYSLNLTALPRQALSDLTAWPAGKTMPALATLTAPSGSVTANAAIVQAGAGGSINVYASQDADFVLDINGYFAPPGDGSLSFYSMTPCRMLDTRTSFLAAQVTGFRHIDALSNSCNVPANAHALVLNATAVPRSGLGYMTLWADREAQPWVSTLNADPGVVTSNLAIVPMKHAAFNAYTDQPTHLILDVAGYFAP